jgi:hypothetical protein
VAPSHIQAPIRFARRARPRSATFRGPSGVRSSRSGGSPRTRTKPRRTPWGCARRLSFRGPSAHRAARAARDRSRLRERRERPLLGVAAALGVCRSRSQRTVRRGGVPPRYRPSRHEASQARNHKGRNRVFLGHNVHRTRQSDSSRCNTSSVPVQRQGKRAVSAHDTTAVRDCCNRRTTCRRPANPTTRRRWVINGIGVGVNYEMRRVTQARSWSVGNHYCGVACRSDGEMPRPRRRKDLLSIRGEVCLCSDPIPSDKRWPANGARPRCA